MTGRIRTVKPEWLEDELLLSMSSDARVLSVALLLLADDYGNGRGSELYLASRVFPGQSRETLASALEELERARYAFRYEVDGQTYFHIRNWTKHQRVDHRGKPKVPEYIGVREDSREGTETVAKDPDGVAPRAIPSISRSYPDPDPDPGSRARAETPCPQDLPERSEAAGIPEQFAKAYRAPAEAVRAHVREIQTFWTIGPGTGRRRRNWLQVVRTRLHELGKAGKLDEPPHAPNEAAEQKRKERLAKEDKRLEAEAKQRLQRMAKGVG